MVLFGGLDAQHGPLDDLWQYCVANRSWTELTPRGAARAWPAARHQHSLTALSAAQPAGKAHTTAGKVGATAGEAGKAAGEARQEAAAALLLFGGVAPPSAAEASPLVDDAAWLYVLSRSEWLRLHTPAGGARPWSRLGHAALAVTPSAAWIHGGLGGGGVALSGAAAQEEDARGGHAGGGGRAVAHEGDSGAWHFELPPNFEAAAASCSGCSVHGACDLSSGRCVCDPPWAGDACDRPQADGVPTAPRRAIGGALWLSGALLVGGVLGWVSRGRALVRQEQERARADARERRYRAGAGA